MRRAITTCALGLALVALPTAALAQEGEDEVGIGEPAAAERDPDQAPAEDQPEDEVGIGDSDAVECRGTVTAAVVDVNGAPVDGAVLSVAGESMTGSGSVESLCGEVAASLLSLPDGYAPAGPTDLTAQVRQATTTAVTFTVDPVEVLGTQFEQPAEAPAAPPPDTADEAAPTAEGVAAPELAATGPEDAPALLLLALLFGLTGTALLGLTPSPARDRAARP